jgi:hypothetical protein
LGSTCDGEFYCWQSFNSISGEPFEEWETEDITPQQLERAKREVFDDLYFAVQAEDAEELCPQPRTVEIFHRLVEQISTPVEAYPWAGWWMATGVGVDYFSSDAVSARAELELLIARLQDGLRRFEELDPGDIAGAEHQDTEEGVEN